ncbi:c-type cytochrome [Riemerella columbipharyngis]|uniref:Cytochrome C oxidase, cbb3-type, subunit III n=1 Tax=Riemerella columbipharyngis TaxID=1071918 RepID=A0A1G7EDU7_9FLAO|nr:cytochrome c [Riemerella columbipharyngis]SDE61858.1 Cytochrome C oxidase, cbb3-type, subunit III [Riemerella columbipharyngis]
MKIKSNIVKLTGIFGLTAIVLNSCGPKENPPSVYFPDMYFPVAYDPLQQADDPYSDHENTIPIFVKNDGATALTPVVGTVPRTVSGLVEANSPLSISVDEYNAGYEASKSVTVSPLDPKNREKDLERGKHLFEITCAACHGLDGDGQGPIVKSGAFSGVPNYKDREFSLGTVHYVIVNGRNMMGSYAGQLLPADRWRIAMYVMSAFKGDNGTEKITSETAVPVDNSTVSDNKTEDNTKK